MLGENKCVLHSWLWNIFHSLSRVNWLLKLVKTFIFSFNENLSWTLKSCANKQQINNPIFVYCSSSQWGKTAAIVKKGLQVTINFCSLFNVKYCLNLCLNLSQIISNHNPNPNPCKYLEAFLSPKTSDYYYVSKPFVYCEYLLKNKPNTLQSKRHNKCHLYSYS